jgi:UDP-glucuronate 4-epimerase
MAEWLCSGLQSRLRRFDSGFSLQIIIRMKKVLITGVAGFIGSNLAKKLLGDKYIILGVDNLNNYYDVTYKKNRLKDLSTNKNFKNFNFLEIDISDEYSTRNACNEFRPDLIINLAAQAGVRYSLENPNAYISSNIKGFSNILEIAKDLNIKNIIYASSSSIYGNSSVTPFVEDMQDIKPISLYAATKASNELLANSYAYNYNMKLVGLRFFTVYGPAGRPDMAYFSFTENIDNDKKITIYNKGRMSRDMTYIDDITNGIVSSINYIDTLDPHSHEIFNLGNENPISVMQLVEFISKSLGKSYINEFIDLNTEVDITYANIDKAKKYLGYKPQTSFETGMNNFISWYQNYFKEN